MNIIRRYGLPLLICLVLLSQPIINLPLRRALAAPASPQANYITGEGFDYATQVIGDPWDMSQFSDISQWLNRLAPGNYLLNIQVQDGVFSAFSDSGDAYFFTLWGGYAPGFRTGKIGPVYPIPSSSYGCYYMAMYQQSSSTNTFYVEWADEVMPPTVKGALSGVPLVNGIWKLYQVNLNTWHIQSGTRWNNRPQWQAFRIVPSLVADVNWKIDWIRLTNCQPVNITLTGIPGGTYSLWIGAGNPERQILVVENLAPTDGNYTLDVQGIEPGNYPYYIKNASNQVIQQGQLNIVPAPILKFTNPSPYSGPDYASSGGNAWDFIDMTDVDDFSCVSAWIENGILFMDTLPPSQAPQCVGSGVMNPMVYLNMPSLAKTSDYRYLSFSQSIDGQWSLPEQGMIVRLAWIVNVGGTICSYYSKEMVLVVGWQTYFVDLFDAWNGAPAARYPTSCPQTAWKDQINNVTAFRLHPNENITDNTFHQQLDWIKLTKVETVVHGLPYSFKATLNKPPSDFTTINFYYTTDRNNPTQNPAQPLIYPTMTRKTYVPLLFQPASSPGVYKLVFTWNTFPVNVGSYFICATVSDGYNTATDCSDALISVTSNGQ